MKFSLGWLVFIFFKVVQSGFCQSDSLPNHQQWVSNLPIYHPKIDSGEYRLPVNGMEFRIRVAGMKNKGENLILLHGFPESSLMWEELLTQAAQAGYRVVAYDQRGYSPGVRPGQVADYQLDKLSADVLAIAQKIGFKKFHLVGHDWGAVVGWLTTITHPKQVLSWTAMSIPHLAVFFKGVLYDPEQQKRSAYFKFLQTPNEPEKLFLSDGQARLKKMLANLPTLHQQEYLQIFADSGAFTAAVNWYRAMDVEKFVSEKVFEKLVIRPTLFIWGTQDGVIAPTIIPQQKKWIKADYQELSLETGHNLMQQKPQEVIQAILARLKTYKKKL
jgi:pimeloyl-ACP methyl ester carboxylesterase